MHQLSKNLEVTCCLCVKGFPFVAIAGKGVSQGCWLADSSVVVCSEVLGSQWLGVGWRMVSESIASLSLKLVHLELDFAANLEHETQQKEKKLK